MGRGAQLYQLLYTVRTHRPGQGITDCTSAAAGKTCCPLRRWAAPAWPDQTKEDGQDTNPSPPTKIPARDESHCCGWSGCAGDPFWTVDNDTEEPEWSR
ncbi:hypothetical protein PoB_002511700 [Plakobranchus ocellatus]|uniref:Uncharacterized protein n=1 Tax=Plakobranchus ocellatus TaxID=259542 RepID=A0AAV3ZU28_9GAST|nr:hypothetical protein PoB_002511700 [Plakobranchus ocellatus]